MKLRFGATQESLKGYITVDAELGPSVDEVRDLNVLPWPWEPESVRMIVASNVVEHLKLSLVEFCDEAWRVLQVGGELVVRTPHHDGAQSWIDPTHRWHLHEESFQFFDPDAPRGRVHANYTSFKWRILSLGVRENQHIHALMTPRK
jgi:hypothetical protein